jgi:hypothetical protein
MSTKKPGQVEPPKDPRKGMEPKEVGSREAFQPKK